MQLGMRLAVSSMVMSTTLVTVAGGGEDQYIAITKTIATLKEQKHAEALCQIIELMHAEQHIANTLLGQLGTASHKEVEEAFNNRKWLYDQSVPAATSLYTLVHNYATDSNAFFEQLIIAARTNNGQMHQVSQEEKKELLKAMKQRLEQVLESM